MKKSLLFFLLFLGVVSLAQAQGFRWQGVANDAAGNPVTQAVTLKFSILKNNAAVYVENQNPITPVAGQISATVGGGTAVQGTFAAIDWANGPFSLKVEMKIGAAGSFLDMGTSLILPVPMALYAASSGGGNSNWSLVNNQLVTTKATKVENSFDVFKQTNDDVYLGAFTKKGTGNAYWAFISSLNPAPDPVRTYFGWRDNYFSITTLNPNVGTTSIQMDNTIRDIRFGAKSASFEGSLDVGNTAIIRGTAIGLPYSNGNILDLVSKNAPGALTFGKLDGNGTSYIQSSTSGNSSRLVLNPHGGGSTSVTIVGSANGNPYSEGTILDLVSTSAEGGLAFGKMNQAGDSYLQSHRVGKSSNLYLNPQAQGTRVVVPILEITGGSDIIEKVISSEKTTPLLPGEVVIMDENNPLAARRSTKSYQKMVIGVISGAGGISHGLSLQQEGVLDGDTPIAVAGRVKVKVVGNVRPGDLLTTSREPGRAMKAKNIFRKNGAIIGKALSKPDADGLVLMLVNLQ